MDNASEQMGQNPQENQVGNNKDKKIVMVVLLLVWFVLAYFISSAVFNIPSLCYFNAIYGFISIPLITLGGTFLTILLLKGLKIIYK